LSIDLWASDIEWRSGLREGNAHAGGPLSTFQRGREVGDDKRGPPVDEHEENG
jgi:hypothetical protein